MDDLIPFNPSKSDIVSTKLRTWNLNHPGNLAYTALVQDRVTKVSGDDIAEIRQAAEEIVSIIFSEGGRFLKLKDGDLNPTECTVMDRRQCVAKVAHAMRTAISRLSGGVTHSRKRKKASISKLSKSRDGTGKDRKSSTPRPRSRRSIAVEPIMYQAQAGQKQNIHKYMLDCISAVCNEGEATTAFRVLDSPIGGYNVTTEPDKQRLMRLSLRQRFAAAASMGMGPLEFAAKLLKLWDGKLVTKKKAPANVVPLVSAVDNVPSSTISPQAQGPTEVSPPSRESSGVPIESSVVREISSTSSVAGQEPSSNPEQLSSGTQKLPSTVPEVQSSS